MVLNVSEVEMTDKKKMPKCGNCSYGSSRISKCAELMAKGKCPEKPNYKG